MCENFRNTDHSKKRISAVLIPDCLFFINFADVLRKGSYSLASYPGLPVFSLFNRDKTMIVSSIASFGRYCMFLTQVFRLPDKGKVFFNRLIFEINKLGVDSIPLVIIISPVHRGGHNNSDDDQHRLAADSVVFHGIGHA